MHRALFEIGYFGSVYGLFHIFCGLCAFLFLCFCTKKIANTDEREENRVIAGTVTKAVMVFMILYLLFLVKSYINVVIPYQTGNYIQIEGVVRKYSNIKGTERFSLKGVEFECSSDMPWGYFQHGDKSILSGNGQYLRIRYIPGRRRNTIVYIEQLKPEQEAH